MFTRQIIANRGFTLIEFLLYMSIVIAMLGVFTGIGGAALQGKNSTETLAEINYSLDRMVAKFETALDQAGSITLPLYANDSSTLVLSMPDPVADPTIFELYEGGIRMKEGSGDYMQISSTNVSVKELTFTNLSVIDSSPAVQVKLKFGTVASSSLEYDFITTLKSRK